MNFEKKLASILCREQRNMTILNAISKELQDQKVVLTVFLESLFLILETEIRELILTALLEKISFSKLMEEIVDVLQG